MRDDTASEPRDELPDEPLAENVIADMARLAAGTTTRLLEIWVRRLCRSHELLRAETQDASK